MGNLANLNGNNRIQDHLELRTGTSLCADEVAELRTYLRTKISEGVRFIRVDMQETMQLDSTAIGLFVATKNSLLPVEGNLTLEEVPEQVNALLRATGLHEHIIIHPKKH